MKRIEKFGMKKAPVRGLLEKNENHYILPILANIKLIVIT